MFDHFVGLALKGLIYEMQSKSAMKIRKCHKCHSVGFIVSFDLVFSLLLASNIYFSTDMAKNFINSSKAEVITYTVQKTTFSIKDFFSVCDQIRRKLRIWSH